MDSLGWNLIYKVLNDFLDWMKHLWHQLFRRRPPLPWWNGDGTRFPRHTHAGPWLHNCYHYCDGHIENMVFILTLFVCCIIMCYRCEIENLLLLVLLLLYHAKSKSSFILTRSLNRKSQKRTFFGNKRMSTSFYFCRKHNATLWHLLNTFLAVFKREIWWNVDLLWSKS